MISILSNAQKIKGKIISNIIENKIIVKLIWNRGSIIKQ